jgi:hypothetical protein
MRVLFIKKTVEPPYTRKGDHGKYEGDHAVTAKTEKRKYRHQPGNEKVTLAGKISFIKRIGQQVEIKVFSLYKQQFDIGKILQYQPRDIHALRVIEVGGIQLGEEEAEKDIGQRTAYFQPECVPVVPAQQRIFQPFAPYRKEKGKQTHIQRKEYDIGQVVHAGCVGLEGARTNLS